MHECIHVIMSPFNSIDFLNSNKIGEMTGEDLRRCLINPTQCRLHYLLESFIGGIEKPKYLKMCKVA